MRRKSAEASSVSGRYSYPLRQTATPILVVVVVVGASVSEDLAAEGSAPAELVSAAGIAAGLLSVGAAKTDFQPLSAAFTMRRTRPRQRTLMLSPKEISEGILTVSSISAPSLNAIVFKRKPPRELTP